MLLSEQMKGHPASFQTVVLDPPWDESGGGKIKRGADRHYKLAKTRDMPGIIRSCPYWDDIAEDAHMYMWVTNNFLPDGLWLMSELGFVYKTNVVWVKPRIGLGQYFRGQHELCLFGVAGASCPERKTEPLAPSSMHPAVSTARSPTPSWTSWSVEAAAPTLRSSLDVLGQAGHPGATRSDSVILKRR